jgi:hypothetical protein
MRTLRKKHVDYLEAITSLLQAVYSYHAEDYERLMTALKTGTISQSQKKYTNEEIAELKATRQFNQRYSKYLRKIIRPPLTMKACLDDWFVRFKVTASAGARPARGRLDPTSQMPLFTEETKPAVENCKEKAQYLSDPLSLEDAYLTIPKTGIKTQVIP